MILLINGNSLHIPLADKSVNCVVTSPPYWALRDYGVDGQIGLEESPFDYVAHMVDVFREVWRVLADNGTLWLNLGDSYAANRGYQVPDNKWGDVGNNRGSIVPSGLKPKDLVGIPWRVAFALQDDGWYLRSDIIWSKPNPMPESVHDRPASSHEYVFLLTKNEKYFYDADAVKEPANGNAHSRGKGNNPKRMAVGRVTGVRANLSFDTSRYIPSSRNLRNVWTIASEPTSYAHFATFPCRLVEPCIKAGCPKGGIVLDPFGGSGTTAIVARRLGRKAIIQDLSFYYLNEIARKRLQLNAIEQWTNGIWIKENDHGDLPLFNQLS